MTDLAPFVRFWHALDDLLEDVQPTWWGAVVTDSRFPLIWDANYARVETTHPDLTLAEVEDALRPALAGSRAPHVHLVLFQPEKLTGLLSELGTRGDRLSWDTVMAHRGGGPSPDRRAEVVEILAFDDAYWRRHRESLLEFEVTRDEAVEQLVRLEREVMLPAGKRWFAVRDRGEIMALGSLLALEGVGYIDHVVTFPAARGRGFASAIVDRIVRESSAAGADHLYLLAEADGGPSRLYERLGFERAGQLASSLRRKD